MVESLKQSHNSNMVMFNFVLLSRSRMFFGDVRKPSLKCLAAASDHGLGCELPAFGKRF